MNLLITGGAGYIGSHVALEALDNGFEVTIFDDLSTGLKENIPDHVKFFYGSTLNNNDLEKLFKQNTFDAVVHLAASKAAGESMLNPAKYAQNNIVGGLNIINACSKNNIKIFIFSSSAAVYGEPKYNPIDESHPKSPTNYYGFTKLIIEKNLKWYSSLNSMLYGSLRYFNAAGFDLMKRVSGIEHNPQNLIPKVMESSIGKRSHINIYGNNYNTKDGTGVRDYVHVSDLAKAHINSIDFIQKQKRNIIINLGNEVGYTVLDIINKAYEISKKSIEYKVVSRREGDLEKIIANSKLANELIGWEPKNSNLDTIIKSTWEIYKTKVI